MKEKAGDKFSKRLEKDKRMQVVFFICSMAILFLVDFIIQKEIKHKVFDLVADDWTWMFQVDNAVCDENELVLKGWAFELDTNSEEEKYEIVLYDMVKEKKYFSEMEYTIREDVNEYFLCEYDYSQSGFIATFKNKKLDLNNGIYEVLLRPIGIRKAIQTGIYYVNGELTFVEPNTFLQLEIEGTDLEKIGNDGVLLMHSAKDGIYVYQYNGELYWIADENYGFVDGDTLVQYQLYTTQPERLPQNRIDNNWDWDNISFWFSKNEICNIDTGKYRVAKMALPQEYSITRIELGNYIDGWIWHASVRPVYIIK